MHILLRESWYVSPFFVIIICIQYYHNNIDNIIHIHDHFQGGNNTEVDMLDLATITSMDDENPVDNEKYLGNIVYSSTLIYNTFKIK